MSCPSLGHHKNTSAHGTVAKARSHSRWPVIQRGITPREKRPSVGHFPSRFSSAKIRRPSTSWTRQQSGKPAEDLIE